MSPLALDGAEGTVRLLLTKIHPCSFGCPLRSGAAVSWIKKKAAIPAGIWRETRRATDPVLVLGWTASYPLLTVRKTAPPLCPLLIRGTRVGASTRQAIRIRAKRPLRHCVPCAVCVKSFCPLPKVHRPEKLVFLPDVSERELQSTGARGGFLS